ncbi:hypothetical protein K0M31_001982 [Melipona bicolor]|uniref:Uncharacterized protein n=1 Tax=Melipona bicolor TaxID=60889 RepID=A0AA40GGK6_9HYME|nr:hypothetical protein K0M31_001982 [Melipona bicolor]
MHALRGTSSILQRPSGTLMDAWVLASRDSMENLRFFVRLPFETPPSCKMGWDPGDDYVLVIIDEIRVDMLNVQDGFMCDFTVYVLYYFDYAHGVCKNDGRLSIVVLCIVESFENCTSFCYEERCDFWKMEFFSHVFTDNGKSNSLVSFGSVGVYFLVVWIFTE